jgi:signal peptidase I
MIKNKINKANDKNLLRRQFKEFFIPSLKPKFFIRLAIVIAITYVLFRFLCIPTYIIGNSMTPTYTNGDFNFCWRLSYLLSKPQRGDIVAIRFAGQKVMYLKRIVALGNETLEIRNGKLFINEKPVEEPYVKGLCIWNLPKRRVGKNKIYVIGDNRSMPMEQHDFGETSIKRVMGKPLW